jgi:hypothetical protein
MLCSLVHGNEPSVSIKQRVLYQPSDYSFFKKDPMLWSYDVIKEGSEVVCPLHSVTQGLSFEFHTHILLFRIRIIIIIIIIIIARSV